MSHVDMRAVGAALVLSGVAGCGDSPSPTSRAALDDATYLTQSTETGSITLSDGRATSVDGTRTDFALVTTAEGDLDLDGEPDAAVILVESDGVNENLQLHAVLWDGSMAEDVAARFVGDRVEVRRLTIDEGIIRVDMMLRERGQPVTAPPSVPYSGYFALTDRGLVPTIGTERVEPDGGAAPPEGVVVIFGHEWILGTFRMADWTGDLEDAEEVPTLRFVAELADLSGASGQMTGFAGCNRVFGNFRAPDDETLHLSGIATTRRACRSDAMDLETRFVAALKSVEGYAIEDDTLEIRFGGGTMRLSRGDRIRAAEPIGFEDEPAYRSPGVPQRRT